MGRVEAHSANIAKRLIILLNLIGWTQIDAEDGGMDSLDQ